MITLRLLRRFIRESIVLEGYENDPRYAEIMAKAPGSETQAEKNSYLRNRDPYTTKKERDTKRDWNDRIIGKSGPERDHLNNDVIKVHWLAGLSNPKHDVAVFGSGRLLIDKISHAIQKYLSNNRRDEQSCVGYVKGAGRGQHDPDGNLRTPSENFLGAILQGWVSLAGDTDLATQMPSYATKQDKEKYIGSGFPKRTPHDMSRFYRAIAYYPEIVVDNWRVEGFILRQKEDVLRLQQVDPWWLEKFSYFKEGYSQQTFEQISWTPQLVTNLQEVIDSCERASKKYNELKQMGVKIFGPDFKEIQVINPYEAILESEKFSELKRVAAAAKATVEKNFSYWVKDKDGSEIGPLDIERLQARKKRGTLTRDTPLRVKGRAGWTTAGDPTLNLGLFDDVKPQETAHTLYYVHTNGQQWGPFTIDQMRSWATSGDITSGTSVWKTGMPGWGTASQVPELASLIPRPTTP